MRESKVEGYLCDRVKALGGIAYKFVSPGVVGVPDRLVCLPGGVSFFVELKRPGRGATEAQGRRHADLRALGQIVYVADTVALVDEVLAQHA